MIFLSILGTQAMAVMNPLLSMIQHGFKPERVLMLATSYIQEQKETQWNAVCNRLMERMEDLGEPQDVEIQFISETLETDEMGRPPAQDVVSELIDGGTRIAFNLAGAMNFQVAACVQSLVGKGGLFLYPEERGVYVVNNDSLQTGEVNVWPLPKAEDVLALQGMVYERFRSGNGRYIKKLFKQCGLLPPADPECGIKINEMAFDCFWNSHNTIRFIKVMLGGKADKVAFRHLAARVNDREFFCDLYHKEVAVLTTSDQVGERTEAESMGNIHFIRYGDSQQRIAEQCQSLRRFMRFRVAAPEGRPASVETYGKPEEAQSALLVALGADVMPTLSAAWSAKPEHLILLYTPDDPVIQRYKRAFVAWQNARRYFKAITFVAVSYLGQEILDFERPPGPKVNVNITPGTKGHSAMLMLWAGRHIADIYSIRGRDLYRFSDHTRRPIDAPPPATVLVLSGHRLLSTGDQADDLQKRSRTYEAITRLLNLIHASDLPISLLFEKEMNLGDTNVEIKREGKLSRAVIAFGSGGGKISIPLTGGEWFEKYVGYRMLACDADDVQVRLRTDWSDATHARARRRASQSDIPNPHMTDIDVVARFGGNYAVIECKSGMKQRISIDAAAMGIKAVADLFGRFAIPMLCLLKGEDEPCLHDSGVHIIGYKTLIDHEAMTNLIRKAIVGRRTTLAKKW